MLHDLLYGVMRRDGTLQVLSRVGGGFDEAERRTMLADLKDMVVESEYAEVNSDHVASQMVRPEWVIEISCLDLISMTTRGAPVNRVVLDYHPEGQGYRVLRRMPLATVISPQFVRRREDKRVVPQDVRIEQVSSIVEVPLWDRDARQMAMPRSEVLRREVYVKQMKGETMVRKLLMWKTNKEGDSEDYPAYVLHFTDFSPSRKTPLAREVRVSSSREQMDRLWLDLIEENVKKGWSLHASADIAAKPAAAVIAAPAAPAASAAAAAPATAAEEAPPVKKRAAKKPAAPVEDDGATPPAPKKRGKKSGS
jgi:hypothetical protein